MSRTVLIATVTLVLGLALGALFGAHLFGTAGAASVPCKVAVKAHKPAPTATPTYRTLVDVHGDQNTQTDLFTARGAFGIGWDARAADASLGGLAFSVELNDARGTLLDLVVNTAAATNASTTEHADCSRGCYFTISALNTRYHLVVLQ